MDEYNSQDPGPKEAQHMSEDKREILPNFEEFMEQMYGVKLHEPTPEELAHIHRLVEKSTQKNVRPDGQEST